ncbi:MAG: FHA domain-containing protein [Coleofasciculaceae cyanobacterium]
MRELTLTWQEGSQMVTKIIKEQQSTKNPGTVRIGRDPMHCDFVLSNPTVSGLHVEIFFNYSISCFALRNLRETNPPLVDGRQVLQEEVPLQENSIIYLGEVELKVLAVSLEQNQKSIPQTTLLPPLQSVAIPQSASSNQSYGLRCPNCDRVSVYEYLHFGCQWCGTSLAADASVLITPNI